MTFIFLFFFWPIFFFFGGGVSFREGDDDKSLVGCDRIDAQLSKLSSSSCDAPSFFPSDFGGERGLTKSLVPIFIGTLSYVIYCIDMDIKNCKDTPSARYYSILRYYSLFMIHMIMKQIQPTWNWTYLTTVTGAEPFSIWEPSMSGETASLNLRGAK